MCQILILICILVQILSEIYYKNDEKFVTMMTHDFLFQFSGNDQHGSVNWCQNKETLELEACWQL
jgi:hypothetical protein